MKRLAAIALLVTACASAPPACRLPERDRAWIDRALEAWRFTSKEITGIGPVPDFEAVFFSSDCTLRSPNALTSEDGRHIKWTASLHGESVKMPDGSEIPAGVTSFAMGTKDQRFFVMSTPSVWEANGVGKGEDLERLMTAVLLHEASHVAQTASYGPRLGALIEANHLPDSFNDNAVQERFKDNADFAASVKEETDLFAAAVKADTVAEAKALARKARQKMLGRQRKWMTGPDAYLVEAEDLWLTFEGAGQWTGYQWLIHPKGGARPTEEVMARFLRGRHWSQTEGFALVMALERLTGPTWKQHAYGDGKTTVLEMLDEALAE